MLRVRGKQFDRLLSLNRFPLKIVVVIPGVQSVANQRRVRMVQRLCNALPAVDILNVAGMGQHDVACAKSLVQLDGFAEPVRGERLRRIVGGVAADA